MSTKKIVGFGLFFGLLTLSALFFGITFILSGLGLELGALAFSASLESITQIGIGAGLSTIGMLLGVVPPSVKYFKDRKAKRRINTSPLVDDPSSSSSDEESKNDSTLKDALSSSSSNEESEDDATDKQKLSDPPTPLNSDSDKETGATETPSGNKVENLFDRPFGEVHTNFNFQNQQGNQLKRNSSMTALQSPASNKSPNHLSPRKKSLPGIIVDFVTSPFRNSSKLQSPSPKAKSPSPSIVNITTPNSTRNSLSPVLTPPTSNPVKQKFQQKQRSNSVTSLASKVTANSTNTSSSISTALTLAAGFEPQKIAKTTIAVNNRLLSPTNSRSPSPIIAAPIPSSPSQEKLEQEQVVDRPQTPVAHIATSSSSITTDLTSSSDVELQQTTETITDTIDNVPQSPISSRSPSPVPPPTI